MKFLRPENIKIRETSRGLELTHAGLPAVRVRPVKAFPMKEPGKYIGFIDESGKVVGMLEDTGGLDPETGTLLEQKLSGQYRFPDICRILSMNMRFGIAEMKVETDENEVAEFSAARDDIRWFGKQLFIRDADGKYYRIEDYRNLDRKSMILLERFI